MVLEASCRVPYLFMSLCGKWHTQGSVIINPNFPFQELDMPILDKTEKLPISKVLIGCYSRVIMQSHRMDNDDELVEDHRRQRLCVLFSALSTAPCCSRRSTAPSVPPSTSVARRAAARSW